MLKDSAWSKALFMNINFIRGNREILQLAIVRDYGPRCKFKRSTTTMNDRRKSDTLVVPEKFSNKPDDSGCGGNGGKGCAQGE